MPRHAGVRLDVPLVSGRGPELALNDQIGICESSVEIPAAKLHPARDVGGALRRRAGLAGRDELVVENGRARCDGLIDRFDRRQPLVLDFDPAGRFACEIERGGRDGRHRMTVIEHLAVREQVVADVVQVNSAFAHHQLGGGLRDVLPRHDGLDAGHRGRRRGVDRQNPRVRVRAAHQRAVQHPGQRKVGSVVGPARDFVQSVMTDRARADLRV